MRNYCYDGCRYGPICDIPLYYFGIDNKKTKKGKNSHNLCICTFINSYLTPT
ncbi:hypothetical protein Patl1_17384 [Pistacia atlantica]|uniref:Uncharacterized protein n=1 Tax=Pistacia atlantica TaxID=434234 RepID=A0ACC1BXX3_9ROSI|nr:hypothetical protein Patl1_17384 [Pistacia atlantica]